MRFAGLRENKEQAVREIFGEQLRKGSEDIMAEITNEIVLTAKKLTRMFLGDVFRDTFSTERSCEFSAPVVFEIGGSTDLILFDRLSPQQLKNLPLFIMNEEVLAKSFNPMRELNFVIFADMSLSMLYRWPLTKLAAAGQFVYGDQIKDIKESCRQTKLYALKYMTYAFLDSAIQSGFKASVTFFNNRQEHVIQAANDNRFPSFALHYMDEHFQKLYTEAISDDKYVEQEGYLDMLTNFVHKHKKCVVLFLSDFLEGIEDIKPYLLELSYRCPVVMGVINDPLEIEFPQQKLSSPVTLSYEHCKNMEADLEQEVRLSNDMIKEHNAKAAERRHDMFNFFSHHKIRYLDIQTQNNHKIPQMLQELTILLLGEL